MEAQDVERRLTSILAADVVGYSRLMGVDEEATLRTLRDYREIIDGLIARHKGRLFGSAGDSVMAEFASPVEAVRCATEIQLELETCNAGLPGNRRMHFRIGVNLGDVMVEGDDLLGDGVNVAARIEGLCEPGAVFVSGSVFDQVFGKIDAVFDDRGERTVKNISRPIRVYCTRPASEAESRTHGEQQALPLAAKTSIAVLPFKNLSSDPDQNYLVDGLRLAIQGSFVHHPELLLLAPPAVARYRDQEVDACHVGRDLGVRFVLEGAAQQSGERLRIMVQLTDVQAGHVVWAERYDRDLADTLAAQDDIALAVVTALDVELLSGEPMRVHLGTLTSLDALNSYYRGLTHFYSHTKTDNAAAKREFEKLFKLQPKSPIAPAYLSMCHWNDASKGWAKNKNTSLMKAVEWAEKAVDFENTNGMAHIVLACIHLINRRHDEALATCYQALDLRPTCPISFITLASILHYCGRSAQAIPQVKAAMRIMNAYPSWFPMLLAAAYRDIGDIEMSIAMANHGLDLNGSDLESQIVLCSDLEIAGSSEQAQMIARKIIEIDPTFSLAEYADTQPYGDTATLKRLIESLRSAGLPA